MYNAHLVKHTDVVTAGDQYNVPVYSAAKFGIVYENTKQTFSGEIMDTVLVPKVVTVRSWFDGKNSKSTLEMTCLLSLKYIRKPSFKHGKSWLKVYCNSVTKSEKKKLLRDCEAEFTTDPYYTKLCITKPLSRQG